MGFILSLLPGLRELRVPLVSGSLWLAAFLTIGWLDITSIDAYIAGNLGLESHSNMLRSFFIIGIAFLVGLLAQSVVEPSVRYAGMVTRRFLGWIESHQYTADETPFGRRRRRPRILFRLVDRTHVRLWPFNPSSRGLLINATTDRLTSAVTSSDMALTFPLDATIAALPLCAPQLTEKSPSQYQEFDRLKSEVELRVAIAPPLVFLSFVLPISGFPFVPLGGIVAAIVLLGQAAGRERKSMELLANAYFLGYIEIPIVKAAMEGLGALPVKPASDPEWKAGLAIALHNRGYFEEASEVLHDIFHECQEIGGEAEIGEYLQNNSPSLHAVWISLEERLGP